MAQRQQSLPSVAQQRVVICSSGVPHPVRGASVVLFFHYIQAVVADGWQVLHVIVPGTGDSSAAIRGYVDDMSRHGNFTAVECAVNPMLAIDRWSGEVRAAALPEQVRREIDEFAPQVMFCLDVSSAALLHGVAPAAKRVVWLGDLTFDTVWYHNLYDARENPLAYLKLPLTLRRRAGWRRFYRETLAGAACVIASSISSVDKLGALGIRSEYLPYPWPVEDRGSTPRMGWPDKPSFFFFGTLSALGSRSAFRFLLDRLYPRLVQAWGPRGFVIYICGMREMPDWVAEAVRTRSELVFKGFVDDLDALGRSCHAMLAPIDVPVGNRSRIVTAMAYGWPVIAHRNTTFGNPDLVSGENCLLASDVEEFIAHMKLTVEKPEAALSLGRAAQACYERTFAPTTASSMLLDRMQALL